MKTVRLLPAFAALALSACATGYGYSDSGYYYSQPSASVSTYYGGGYGYGYPGYSGYGYGMGYGYPGYYGYYDPYSGYYYDPYYGYYIRRPPVVIIQPPPEVRIKRPPGDHLNQDDDNRQPWPPGHGHAGHTPRAVYAPGASGGAGRREVPPMASLGGGDAPRRPDGVRMASPLPPSRQRDVEPSRPPERIRMAPPPRPADDDGMPRRQGDRSR